MGWGWDVSEALQRARDAYGGGDWVAARDAFRAAAQDGPLAADDLAALASSAWWLGDVDEANRLLDEAHCRYLDAGCREEAASTALELAINYFLRGDEPMGSGWIGRATRLVEDVPEGPVHGYLTFVLEVEAAIGSVDPDGVIGAARRVQELGRRFGDANLVALGLNGEGRMLIRHGRTAEGMALLDEAMISVLAGEIVPHWAGNIYCNTIAACHELVDLRRMTKWTEATEQWLRTIPGAVLFTGICRVHRAQILRVTGDWERAEREAARVCADLAGVSVANVAEAWYQVGEVRRLRGAVREAEQAYQAAREHGRDPQPGLALLRLAQGRIDMASASIHAALVAAGGDRLTRAQLCAAHVEIAVAAGHPEAARTAGDELAACAATYASPGIEAMAVTAGGTVALAEGRLEDALPALRDACRRWQELEAPYDAARACVLLARTYEALGDADAVAMELDAAAAVFDRLGATGDAARVVELRGTTRLPGGLSAREVEVLKLVASGRTNREIAEALFISQKTVDRHLSNIFTKLGVASRTEATRYAFEHGLTPISG